MEWNWINLNRTPVVHFRQSTGKCWRIGKLAAMPLVGSVQHPAEWEAATHSALSQRLFVGLNDQQYSERECSAFGWTLRNSNSAARWCVLVSMLWQSECGTHTLAITDNIFALFQFFWLLILHAPHMALQFKPAPINFAHARHLLLISSNARLRRLAEVGCENKHYKWHRAFICGNFHPKATAFSPYADFSRAHMGASVHALLGKYNWNYCQSNGWEIAKIYDVKL